MSKTILRTWALATLALALNVAHADDSNSTTMTIEQWRAQANSQELDRGSLRPKMVREAAMSAGMRAGLAKQAETINKMLDKNGRYLDDIYAFSTLMLPDNVAPPVVRRVDNLTEQEGDLLRFSTVKFRIVKQARFTTKAPTWREYLTVPVWDNAGRTHPSLLPKNGEEERAAKDGLDQGWRAGQEQANQMFYLGLERLQNDYLGMVTYHALLKSKMITLPRVLRNDIPVSGDGNSMTVDQVTYALSSKPVFNPQMMDWLALVDASAASNFLVKQDLTDQERKRQTAAPTYEELKAQWNLN